MCNQDSYNATSCDFLEISVVQFVMYLIGLKGQFNFPFLSKIISFKYKSTTFYNNQTLFSQLSFDVTLFYLDLQLHSKKGSETLYLHLLYYNNNCTITS